MSTIIVIMKLVFFKLTKHIFYCFKQLSNNYISAIFFDLAEYIKTYGL